MPLNFTAVVPVKLLPLMVTTLPTAPDEGLNVDTTGELTTVMLIAFDCDEQVAGLEGNLVLPPVHRNRTQLT